MLSVNIFYSSTDTIIITRCFIKCKGFNNKLCCKICNNFPPVKMGFAPPRGGRMMNKNIYIYFTLSGTGESPPCTIYIVASSVYVLLERLYKVGTYWQNRDTCTPTKSEHVNKIGTYWQNRDTYKNPYLAVLQDLVLFCNLACLNYKVFQNTRRFSTILLWQEKL